MVAPVARPGLCRNPSRRPLKRAPSLICLTTGEPAGIGPDLSLVLAARRGAAPLLIGDVAMLRARARRLRVDVALVEYPAGPSVRGAIRVLHVPLAARVRPGLPDPANAAYVLRTLDVATELCVSGACAAMVTAPVHKGVINDAGIAFTGHTEYLAQKTGTARVVMLLAGGRPPLRVALATTHVPLAAVPGALDRAGLEATLRILAADLRDRFGIARPRILVAGLNPHAGESGHMGREEIDIIAPAVAACRALGMRVEGPMPADTLFTPRLLERADAVLAMYHDQGLPVLKYATFGHGVNVTLGLPIIRTSVDHGTALDLAKTAAGARSADAQSLVAAFRLARELSTRAGAAARRPARKRSG